MIEKIIRAAKGIGRREIPVDQIEVPDLWHTAMYLKDHGLPTAGDQVLDCWHLSHDLITNIQAHNRNIKL